MCCGFPEKVNLKKKIQNYFQYCTVFTQTVQYYPILHGFRANRAVLKNTARFSISNRAVLENIARFLCSSQSLVYTGMW